MSEVPMIRERDGFRNGRSCVHFVFMTSLTAQIVYCANGYYGCIWRKGFRQACSKYTW